jgi:hypothetical protein
MTANTHNLISTVAAEVAAGDVLTMPQVARRCGSTRQGRPVHPATPLRWVFNGVRTPDGRRIKLEAVRCGRWVTSLAAFQRFLEAQTPSLETDSTPQPRTPTRTAKRREREIQAAGKQLETMGL